MKDQVIWVDRCDLIDGFPENLFIKAVPPEQITANAHQRFIRNLFTLAVGFTVLDEGRAGPPGKAVIQDMFEMSSAGWTKDYTSKSVMVNLSS